MTQTAGKGKPGKAEAKPGDGGTVGAESHQPEYTTAGTSGQPPPELAGLRQWVAYELRPSANRPGKTDKIPMNPYIGRPAQTNNPKTWGTWADAQHAVTRYKLAGVGFVFTDADPYCGIDLDDAVDADGNLHAWADEIVHTINSYAEWSQSGTGVHIICRANLPPGGRKQGHVELYDAGRFFVWTNRTLAGHETINDRQAEVEALHAATFGRLSAPSTPTRPPQPVDLADGDLLDRAMNARNGSDFAALWRGDLAGHPTQSEADLALANRLMFWTGGDLARADRMFRQSGLMRAKWDKRCYSDGRTYGQATMQKALDGTTEYYHPGNGTEAHAPAPEPPEYLDADGTEQTTLAAPGTATASSTAHARQTEHLTDLGNAFRLVRKHGDDLRHVTGWGWLAWDGMRWQRDAKPAYNLAKAAALDLYGDAQDLLGQAKEHLATAQRAAELGDERAATTAHDKAKELQGKAAAVAGWAKASQSRGRIDAAVALAESEPAVSVRSDGFDANPWLLNCNNGTVDLRTGTLRPHAREDLLTRLAPVAYDPAAACPTWDAFLIHIMAGDAEMVRFLQRSVGYSLTGSVQEQCLFFPYGGGANGKSTFLKALLSMMGRDYATQAAPDLLTIGRDRHPTELADLAGVRFVASIEVADGKRLAEALVKQLTGGDPVKARLMRQDFFQFDPTFKIWLAANHKPIIQGTDLAIWRRIRLIPFTVTIPEAEQDKRLGDKLLAELPGILAWAVRGCLAWQHDGLGVPAAVTAATEAYRAESDQLAAFLEECIDLDPTGQEQAGPLYQAYKTWTEANGLGPRDILTNVRFGRALEERGFDKYKDPGGRHTFYAGLTIHT